MMLWLADLIAWMNQAPQWVPDVTLGVGVVGIIVEVAFLVYNAVNRQASIDGGRTWHRSSEKAYRLAGTRVLDPAVARMLGVNARSRSGHPREDAQPSVERTVRIWREGDREHIQAREVEYR